MADVKTFIGDYLQVLVDGHPIANATSCKISFKWGNVKTTTKSTTTGANTYDYTDSDWDVSCDHLYAMDTDAVAANFKSLAYIKNAADSKTKVTIKFGSLTSGEEYYSGVALVVSADANAPQKAETSLNCSFKGDGQCAKAVNP